MPVGQPVDVDVELEATSWRFDAGHRLRLAIAGTDWPNTVAPPAPVVLDLDLGATTLHLPRVDGPGIGSPPSLVPSAEQPDEPTDVVWRVERDILLRETSCVVDHGSTYDEPGVTCTDHYVGRVTVNTETFAQRMTGTSSFTLAWPDVTVTSSAELRVDATESAFEIDLSLECTDGDAPFAHRRWQRTIPRDLG
jgi:hypothetical protein